MIDDQYNENGGIITTFKLTWCKVQGNKFPISQKRQQQRYLRIHSWFRNSCQNTPENVSVILVPKKWPRQVIPSSRQYRGNSSSTNRKHNTELAACQILIQQGTQTLWCFIKIDDELAWLITKEGEEVRYIVLLCVIMTTSSQYDYHLQCYCCIYCTLLLNAGNVWKIFGYFITAKVFLLELRNSSWSGVIKY
jgi:hypothetical protein